MADILKISTPLVDRNNMVQQNRQPAEIGGVPFQLTETTKVIQTNAQSELLQQNNGMPPREETPEILMNLLKDPGVTVSFLKNIYLLQEIINLIPVNNNALTGEIQKMFEALLLNPGEITGELLQQENASTTFKGDFFDLLRELAATAERPDLRQGVAGLLKALNATLTKRDILQSVGNSLSFLANNLSSSKGLFARLESLAQRFGKPDAAQQFSSLKGETLALLREVEGSILFTPRLAKLLPLITYNLSRFGDNPDHLQDAVNRLLSQLDGREMKGALLGKLRAFLGDVAEKNSPEYREEQTSKVMTALTRLIGKEAAEEMNLASSDKLDKIIQSLLSSPCNFTPLLHYIIPVQDGDLRSFAEMWIDPNEGDGGEGKDGKSADSMHMLIVFDIEGLGQFEAELLITGKKIGLNLFCPAAYVDRFAPIRDYAAKMTANSEYSFGEVYVGRLERSRSLMDVFKTLPHRRAGIDVTV